MSNEQPTSKAMTTSEIASRLRNVANLDRSASPLLTRLAADEIERLQKLVDHDNEMLRERNSRVALLESLVNRTAHEPQPASSKELAYRDALARIRQICRSDAKGIEAATIERRQVYDIANMALDAHGDLYASGHEPPASPWRTIHGHNPDGSEQDVTVCLTCGRLEDEHDDPAEFVPRASQPRPAVNPMGPDSDWVLAIGHALGLDSGYYVPIVPSVDEFKQLFAAVRASQPPGAKFKVGDRVEWTNLLNNTFTGNVTEVRSEPRYIVQFDDRTVHQLAEGELRATSTKGEG